MTERPILMSAPMVRALLAGRKAQTRRVVKHEHASEIEVWAWNGVSWRFGVYGEGGVAADMGGIQCPYGVPGGTRLWVRETWAKAGEVGDATEYRADNHDPSAGKWRPSIHMPRWASRITLAVTAVRVERLQDISEADAVAEGTPCRTCGRHVDGHGEDDCECFHSTRVAVESYRSLWESINGPGSWAANPWVWAISFEVLR